MEIENNLKSKISVVVGLVVIVVGIIYLFSLKNPHTPYQVLTPENYPAGTTISLYKDVPQEFPAGIILENKTLNYAGKVSMPNKKTQISVSYVSDKSIGDLFKLYNDTLTKNNWRVANDSSSFDPMVLRAIQNDKTLLITIASLKGKVLMSFQYEY